MSSKSLKIDGITLLGVTSNPANPSNGDIIYRSDLGKFLMYESSGWNESVGATGLQGATGVGLQGATGIAGSNGATGLQGLTGVGLQGATGVSGGGGGGGDDVIGSLKYSKTQPTSDYVLSNQILSKSTYPTLSAQLGDIPDFPSQTVSALNVTTLPPPPFLASPTTYSDIFATNGSIYVVVGNSGTILTSTDGITWTTRISATTATISAIAYGNGTFVILASAATAVLTSTDGINWVNRETPSGILVSMTSLTFGNGVFVIVGSNGYIISSPDGITWTQRLPPVTPVLTSFTGIIYTNFLFVAFYAATANSYSLATSPDGITWTLRTGLGSSVTIQSVVYANGIWLAGVNSSIYSSTDLITWTLRQSLITQYCPFVWNSSCSLWCATSGNGVFTSPDGITWTQRLVSGQAIVVSNGSFFVSCSGNIMTSSDGITWTAYKPEYFTYTRLYSPAPNILIGISNTGSLSYVNGVRYPLGSSAGGGVQSPSGTITQFFVASTGTALFATSNTIGTLYTSTDGITWTLINAIPQGATAYFTITSIAYLNNLFIAYATSSNNAIFTSTDGITWTQRLQLSLQMYCYAYGAGLWVAGGANGNIYTSPDGIVWLPRTSNTSGQINNIIYDASVGFIASGFSAIVTSPDGITWTSRVAANSSMVIHAGGQYVTVGSTQIWTSPDTITWTVRSAASINTVCIAYGLGLYVAVGSAAVYTSPDGITWTQRVIPVNSTSLYYVLFDVDKFIACGTGGIILVSTNGITWTNNFLNNTAITISKILKYNSKYITTGSSTTGTPFWSSSDAIGWTPSSTYLTTSTSSQAIAYGNSTFVAVGTNGCIFSSSDGITWTARPSGQIQTFTSIIYGNSLFVAVGNNGLIMTSPDGITWTARPSTTIANYISVVWTGLQFTAFAQASTGFYTSISPDGLVWTTKFINILVAAQAFSSVIYGNSKYVAVGNYTSMVSSDGLTWSVNGLTTQALTGAYGNSVFVYGGAGGAVGVSSDGITWDTQVITTDGIMSVCFDGSIFIAVTGLGNILNSADGKNWYLATNRLNKLSTSSNLATNSKPVAVNNNLYIPVIRSAFTTYNEPIVKLPYYSYNTANNFFVSSFGGLLNGFSAWIKAKLNGVG